MEAGSREDLGSVPDQIGALLPGDRAAAVIGVIRDGRTSIAVAGSSTVESDTLFEFGSITKVVTANILAQLVDEGAVDLNDKVVNYLPDGPRADGWETVTLRQLATHSAGLRTFPANLRPVKILFSGQLSDPFARYGDGDLLQGIGRTRPRHVGERWQYSNFGMSVLGYALSQATGVPFVELAEDRVLTPLGMSTATMRGWSSDKRAPPLTGRGRLSTYWNFDAFAPAGALRGTVYDGLALLAASLAACTSKDPVSRANCAARKPEGVRVAETAEMGLGWILMDVDGTRVIAHNGGTGGFSSFLGFSPRHETGIVILTNVEGLRDIDTIAQAFLSNG